MSITHPYGVCTAVIALTLGCGDGGKERAGSTEPSTDMGSTDASQEQDEEVEFANASIVPGLAQAFQLAFTASGTRTRASSTPVAPTWRPT